MNSLPRQLLHALLYLGLRSRLYSTNYIPVIVLHPCSRVRIWMKYIHVFHSNEQLMLPKFSPSKFVVSPYIQDVLYADFAGAKIGEKKIQIRATHPELFLTSGRIY